jgi:signal transduction histidine kinase
MVREWLRPPRQVLVIFLTVALVSTGVLGWLAWTLIDQDRALENQRRQDQLEATADRAVNAMEQSVARLETILATPSAGLPDHVSFFSVSAGKILVQPAGSLPYVPVSGEKPEPSPAIFAEGDRLEFRAGDVQGAIRVYQALSATADPQVRAVALARLGRLDRKAHWPKAALDAYRQLAHLDDEAVDGLPAGLVGRLGIASTLAEGHRVTDLRDEAVGLSSDLANGRWRLTEAQYRYSAAQVREWGATVPDLTDALTRAEAVAWVWSNPSVNVPARKLLELPDGVALVVWRRTGDDLSAVAAGPAFLAALASKAVPAGFGLALTNQDGRTVAGSASRSRQTAIRAASASAPWTLHVFATSGAVSGSPRRNLLIMLFGGIALVLVSGWYFILRAISRELRVGRLQADFVAAVSHEFRSPLTSLSHVAEMLSHDRLPTEDLRQRSYGVLVRETDRLRGLVEHLLDFRRFDRGAEAFKREPLDVAALLRAVVADFEARLTAGDHAIDLSVAEEPVQVRADREALARTIWNLLDNAVKYSSSCPTVWVTMARHNGRVVITVRDQGIGIPIEEQREIFGRFVRGSEPKAKRIAGTGIGLTMADQIVRAHGGTIEVASTPGVGSTFSLQLPVLVTAETRTRETTA